MLPRFEGMCWGWTLPRERITRSGGENHGDGWGFTGICSGWFGLYPAEVRTTAPGTRKWWIEGGNTQVPMNEFIIEGVSRGQDDFCPMVGANANDFWVGSVSNRDERNAALYLRLTVCSTGLRPSRGKGC